LLTSINIYPIIKQCPTGAQTLTLALKAFAACIEYNCINLTAISWDIWTCVHNTDCMLSNISHTWGIG